MEQTDDTIHDKLRDDTSDRMRHERKAPTDLLHECALADTTLPEHGDGLRIHDCYFTWDAVIMLTEYHRQQPLQHTEK